MVHQSRSRLRRSFLPSWIFFYTLGSFMHTAKALSRLPTLSKRPLQDRLAVERSLVVQRGFTRVIGSDESGTGCIAGPIVCCSVCINQDLKVYQALEGVDDGKIVNAATRQAIYQYVMSHPETYSVAISIVDNDQIDASGAQSVTLEAFRETIKEIVADEDQHTYYSIVDGHRSPHPLSIPSRPMVQADANVYTVALASILARATREDIMRKYSLLYPEYNFDQNGGYSTRQHVQAIHTHGPSPIHRSTTKPVKGHYKDSTPTGSETVGVSRRRTLWSAMAAALTLPQAVANFPSPAVAMTMNPKTGIALPDPGEIESSVPQDWSVIDNPFDVADAKTRLFGRLDATSDAQFYAEPRLVEHVDEQAVRSMTAYVSKVIAGTDSVLDLCTSWTSHMQVTTDSRNSMPSRIAGLGMNQQELAANAVLTERIVQDLNERPRLPFESDSFNVVLCQLSIDYLTRPLEVCPEIGRVLKPGGTVHIIFSNRLFLQKAVALWTGADDIDHCFTVASYLHFCKGGFENIQALDLSVRGRNSRIIGDPLYVVTANKLTG